MKKFSFRLARVLRVRRIQEQVARAEFLERQGLAHAAQASLAEAEASKRALQEQLAEELEGGPVDPRRVLRHQTSIDGMASLRHRRSEQAKTLDMQAEQARAPWSEALTEVRALEHFEETKRERFRIEREKQENQELDEVASRRAQGTPRVHRQGDSIQ